MIRKQYHGRHTTDGFLVWHVQKLLEQSKNLPIDEIAVDRIRELDETYWYQNDDTVPTCRSIAEHMLLVKEVSLDFPILLCAEGKLMDGMHRVVKAYCHKIDTIKARRFGKTPPPDFVNVRSEDLP